MLKLLHWSDSHGYASSAQTAIRAAQSTPSLDFCIHTGDICSNVIEDGFAYASPITYGFTPGNHDAFLRAGTSGSPYNWSKYHPSQQQMYDTFYKNQPLINKINITAPNTWWYKTFNEYVLIGLDNTAQEPYATQEANWLEDVLDKCRTQSKSVIIAQHNMPPSFDVVNNNFTNPVSTTNYFDGIVKNYIPYYPAFNKIYDKISEAINKGLDLCLWICGHTHFDTCGVSKTSVKFPCFAIDCSIIYEGNVFAWNDTNRSTQDTNPQNGCCNLYQIDSDYIRVYRLGANFSVNGTVRNCAIWDRKSKKFVYTWN